MNRIAATFTARWLLLVSSLFLFDVALAQNSVTVSHPPDAVTILDSTKQQDGLKGSVRRVKTESSKLELKAGRLIEGPRQLIEVTTYDISGKRIENFSYPVASSPVGKEEYEYDARGNIVAMTMRNNGGTILSKETYTYEFDPFGNWISMVTNLVVFEAGALKQEPIEVTYRSLTYYFDDSVAKIVDAPAARKSIAIPATNTRTLSVKAPERPPLSEVPSSMAVHLADPPPELKRPASPQGEVVSATRSATPNVISRERAVESAPLKKATGNSYLEANKTGLELFEMGDFKGAADAFLRSIELERNSAEVHLNLGHAYLKLSKNNDAAKAFKECTRLNPQMVDGHYGFGLASFRMRRFPDAANAFKRAISLRPTLAKAHYGLALSYRELRDERGVTDEYKILQTLDPGLAKQLAKTFTVVRFPCKVPPFCL